jgi:transcriptional regulator with XRE-family HTH domain
VCLVVWEGRRGPVHGSIRLDTLWVVVMDAGALVSRARVAAGVSQEELARRAGTSRPTVSAYEHGRKSPSAQTLSRLLAVLGYELVAVPAVPAVPAVTWSQYPMGRGRSGWVASELWRIPIGQALTSVTLPVHLNWSAPGRAFDLRDRRQRARAYEVILREGTPGDLLRYVDGVLLVEVWSDLVIARAVRVAWQPLILG